MAIMIQIQIIVAMSFITLSTQRAMDDSDKICTLEGMKMFAAQACEHIFERSARTIFKRQIQNGIFDDINDFEETKYTPKGHRPGWRPFKIHRRDFPRGGYLLIDHHHAKVLRKQNHEPEYIIEPSKMHSKKYLSMPGLRDKRANNDDRIPVHYCCGKRCSSKEFCKR